MRGIEVKSLLTAFLIAIVVVSGFSLAGIMHLSLAQDSTSFKISGYILDSDGHGIAGANIIFNVPSIVPSVYSNSSGYYVISAPAGTYHINVWPPFDSNFINYDEPGFVVGSDITKNITLTSGYKVSGYISDSAGTPVVGAAVLLRNSVNTFGSGWFSNIKGYYFLSVPAGTYTIDAHPRTGYNYSGPTTNFPTYYEYDFTVNSNTVKNITVGGTSPAPSPTPVPAPEPSPPPTGSVINSNPSSWPMFHNDLAHSGYSASPGPLTNQILWKYQTGSSVESSPAIVGGVVYFGALWNGNNGFVCALNATTGLKIWQFATDSGVESSPAVVAGVVYIGSYGGRVYALKAANGSLIWSFNTGGSVFSSPAVVDGTVYVGSASGNLYALNAANGYPSWSYHTGGTIYSSPAVVNGVVYFGSQDQNVYALRASDGHQIWHYTTGSYVDTSPAVVDGMVYFGSRDGYVYALNANSGSKIWSFHSPRRPIDGRSYYYSTPAVANGVVYFGMYDSYIYALSAATGGLIWEFPTGGYVFSSPVVAGGVVYAGSFDGNVYALDAMTGSKIWSYQTGNQMRSSAAVANGVVYVGSGDGYLYAFGSNTTKNINVGISSTPSPSPTPTPTPSPKPSPTPSPTPSPAPVPNQSLPSGSDDFSQDSGLWQYLGSAYRDQMNQYLVLTTSEYHTGGAAFFNAPIQGTFTATFRYKVGGGYCQGDGFTMFFYKQKYSTIGAGGSQGFTTYNNEIVRGYGIEFDGWQNIPQDFQQFVGGQINPPQGDPSFDHIALIEGYVGNHLTYVNDPRIADNNWHQVTVEVQEASVKVFVDNGLVLQWTGALNRTYDGFGFSGGTGGPGSNWHIIDDFSITASSEIVNFAETQLVEKNLLSVTSNSTVTSLACKSTTSELSFTVSGPSETTGYVKVAIAKSLVSNPETIKVYLDGNQLSYELTSNADSWLLSFTYAHSTHHVSINLAANNGGPILLAVEYWTWIVVAIITAVIGSSLLVYFKKRKR